VKRMVLTLIVALSFINPAFAAKNFTYDNLFVSFLALGDPNLDELSLPYMRAYHRDMWLQYKDDEFEIEDKKSQMVMEMKGLVEAYDETDTYVIRTTVDFGEYNFSAQSWPVDMFTKDSYFSESLFESGMPRHIRVFFSNAETLPRVIPMQKAEAKAFLDSRKGYGSVDRRLYTRIEFVVKRVVQQPRSSTVDMYAEVTDIKFFKDERYQDEIKM